MSTCNRCGTEGCPLPAALAETERVAAATTLDSLPSLYEQQERHRQAYAICEGNMAARIAALEAEVARLTEWKKSAMAELARWDALRPIVAVAGGRIGHALSDEALRLWQEDRAEIATLRGELAALREKAGEAFDALETLAGSFDQESTEARQDVESAMELLRPLLPDAAAIRQRKQPATPGGKVTSLLDCLRVDVMPAHFIIDGLRAEFDRLSRARDCGAPGDVCANDDPVPYCDRHTIDRLSRALAASEEARKAAERERDEVRRWYEEECRLSAQMAKDGNVTRLGLKAEADRLRTDLAAYEADRDRAHASGLMALFAGWPPTHDQMVCVLSECDRLRADLAALKARTRRSVCTYCGDPIGEPYTLERPPTDAEMQAVIDACAEHDRTCSRNPLRAALAARDAELATARERLGMASVYRLAGGVVVQRFGRGWTVDRSTPFGSLTAKNEWSAVWEKGEVFDDLDAAFAALAAARGTTETP